MTETTVI